MFGRFSKHPPHATEDESSGPPNAQRRGLRFILINSVGLAVLAMVVIYLFAF